MGHVHPAITPPVAAWIAKQHLFFVATAPTSEDGRVNLSPKGLDTFRVLDEHSVAYLDLTGSGVETISHLRENGRITLMWCAFDGPPRIVRIHGRGQVLPLDDPLVEGRFPDLPGARAVIVVQAERVSDSCGFAVPEFSYVGDRSRLLEWAADRGEAGLVEYREEKNAVSIDGLPGF